MPCPVEECRRVFKKKAGESPRRCLAYYNSGAVATTDLVGPVPENYGGRIQGALDELEQDYEHCPLQAGPFMRLRHIQEKRVGPLDQQNSDN